MTYQTLTEQRRLEKPAREERGLVSVSFKARIAARAPSLNIIGFVMPRTASPMQSVALGEGPLPWAFSVSRFVTGGRLAWPVLAA